MTRFLLALAMLFATHPAAAAVKVVTSTQDLAAIVQAVGGSDVTVTSIARGDLDPHFVDAKPSFMVKLASADLVVCVGLELEIGWLPSLLTGSRNPKVQPGAAGYLDASAAISPIEKPTGAIDRSRGDIHPLGNPHYWLDPENGRKVARLVAQKLTGLDAAHSADYSANLAAFESTLTQKEATWKAKMAPLQGANVVGYHSTFDYFSMAYGMNVIGFVEPKPGIPPTPAHTLEIAQKAKDSGAKLVLVEPYHNPSGAQPVADASGAKVVVVPTSVGSATGIDTYFDLFDHIVSTVTGAVITSSIVMLMLPAFTACVVLLGIHVYLGIHVLSRGVIFVDLALAQVAALGVTTALLLGAEPGSGTTYLVSLGFTMVGALLFTFARGLSDRVPVEAIIGIVYAVASAIAVILADRLPHGADEIREILVGDLLAVQWPHIVKTAIIYAAIGAFHFAFRRQFLLISTDPERAEAEGIRIPLWDLLFYLSFGVVITSAVAIGGVLIVFSYLVIPAVIVALFTRNLTTRLFAGWGVGILASALGMYTSYTLDTPTGAAVVACFGGLLLVAIGLSRFVELPAAESSPVARHQRTAK